MYHEQWVNSVPTTIEFVEGLHIDLNDRLDDQDGKVILIVNEYLMSECVNDKRLASLFSKKSHHRNCSVIFIVQNLFVQGKEMRNITQNYHYMVLFKNPRNGSVIGQTNVSWMVSGIEGSLSGCHQSDLWIFPDWLERVHSRCPLSKNRLVFLTGHDSVYAQTLDGRDPKFMRDPDIRGTLRCRDPKFMRDPDIVEGPWCYRGTLHIQGPWAMKVYINISE